MRFLLHGLENSPSDAVKAKIREEVTTINDDDDNDDDDEDDDDQL